MRVRWAIKQMTKTPKATEGPLGIFFKEEDKNKPIRKEEIKDMLRNSTSWRRYMQMTVPHHRPVERERDTDDLVYTNRHIHKQ
jgi:hypothetical protein